MVLVCVSLSIPADMAAEGRKPGHQCPRNVQKHISLPKSVGRACEEKSVQLGFFF